MLHDARETSCENIFCNPSSLCIRNLSALPTTFYFEFDRPIQTSSFFSISPFTRFPSAFLRSCYDQTIRLPLPNVSTINRSLKRPQGRQRREKTWMKEDTKSAMGEKETEDINAKEDEPSSDEVKQSTLTL